MIQRDTTPDLARRCGLPEHGTLQYARELAWLAIALFLLVYIATVSMRSPRALRRILKKRVGA